MSYLQTSILESVFQIPQIFTYVYFFSNVLKLKHSFLKTYLIYSAMVIGYSFLPFENRNAVVLRLCAYGISIFVTFCFFDGSFFRKLIAYIYQLTIVMLTDFSCLGLLTFISLDFSGISYPSKERYIGMAMATVVMFPLYMLSIIIYNRAKQYITKRYIFSVLILPIVQLFLLCLNMAAVSGTSEYSDIVLIYFNQAIFIILECLQFSAVKNSIAYEKQQQELQAYQQKSEMDYQFYKLTETHMQTISQMRHDIHNQISAIRGLISEKNLELAGELSRSLSDELKAMRPLKYCENTVVNTVVTIKQQEAQESDIYTSFQLNDTSKLSLASHTLCSLFTNLLDNAIESCKKCPSDIEKKIKMTTGICSGQMVINMENSTVDADLAVTSEIPNTTKIEDIHSHGLGMRIIKKIVDESNGSFQYQRNNGIFKITVIIPTEETNT